MTDPPMERLDTWTEAYLRFLAREGLEPAVTDLPPRDQAEAEALRRLYRVAWGSATDRPPPLEDDPLAIALGVAPARPAPAPPAEEPDQP